MRRVADAKVLAALFAAALACLAALFGVTWAKWVQPTDAAYDPLIWELISGLGAAATLMALWGISRGGRARWLAFSLLATLVLGFSALTILSVGILIAPVGLVLIGFSLARLFSGTAIGNNR